MMDLVSVDWLAEHLNDEAIVILDASVQSTAQTEVPNQEFVTIKNARFFDLKKRFSNQESSFPNTIPTAEQFELEARKLGINKDSKIVVFDNLGIYTSPRAWWLFKIMGHKNVSVLNGGLPEWIKQGNKTAIEYLETVNEGNFNVEFQDGLLITYNAVLKNSKNPQSTVIDARSKGRFDGVEKEPRKHLKSGHIPNSINIPYKDLLVDGKFKSKEELIEIFESKLVADKEFIFSCGSGITASIVMLASHIAGYNSKKLYDGSWSEWAELQGLIVE